MGLYLTIYSKSFFDFLTKEVGFRYGRDKSTGRVTFRESNTKTWKLGLHGNEEVKKWKRIIRMTHPRKKAMMESIIKRYADKKNNKDTKPQ